MSACLQDSRLTPLVQTKASPPIPALRLLLVVSLLAFGTLLALDSLSLVVLLARRAWRHFRSSQQQRQRSNPTGADVCGGIDVEAGSAGSAAGSKAGSEGKEEAGGAAEGLPAADGSQAAANGGSINAGSRAAAAAAGDEAVQRPDIPLKRGLSRRLVGFEARHPRSASCWACQAQQCCTYVLFHTVAAIRYSKHVPVRLAACVGVQQCCSAAGRFSQAAAAPPCCRAYRCAAAGSIAVSMALAGGCQVRWRLVGRLRSRWSAGWCVAYEA